MTNSFSYRRPVGKDETSKYLVDKVGTLKKTLKRSIEAEQNEEFVITVKTEQSTLRISPIFRVSND